MAESPFVLLLMPLLSGIFLGVVFSFGNILPILQTCIFTIVFTFCILNWKYADWKIYRKPWIGGILIHLFLFLLGIFLAEKNKEINNSNHFSKQKATSLIVTIIQEPKQTGNLIRFNSLVTHTSFNGKISVSSGSLVVALKLDSSQKNKFNYGDELLISNQYKPVDAPFNPAEFNYKLWLQHQNIYFQTFLNPNQYQLIATDRGNPIIAYALAIRQKLVQKYQKYLHDSDALSVASTLILGYRADLSADVLQSYSKTGTIHVLSVSGMHVALVYLIINVLLRFLNRKRSGVLMKALISIFLIWVYALITGFSPAVCRAAVMITFVIVGKTYNRHISMLNILLVSAFVLLLYNPNFITDVGFQLSYLAVVGLIILQPIIENLIEFKHQFTRRIWSLLSVSLAAQLITFPISVFYFHQFPVYFLLSNLFIVLPSALIMYVGIAFLFVPDIPIIAKPVAFILEKSIVGMNQGLSWIEHLPFGSWNKIWITTSEYLILYSIIICVFAWLVHRKSLLLQVGAVFIVLFLVSFSYKKIQAQQQDEIVFLNLRKYYGIVFKKGNEAVVLTNLITSDKSFQYSVQPYLDSCKLVKITLLNPNQNFANTVFIKQNKLVQFKNQLIFVADKDFEQQSFPKKIKVDAVFITQNPRIDLSQITKNLIFDVLIVTSDNGDYLIQKLTKEAAADGRKIIVLKRNKAFILPSNLQRLMLQQK